MPKSYSEKEKEQIKAELKHAAIDSMKVNGIKRTTVDDLVKKVKIPKGTFYLFYSSKELLMYDAFMQIEEETHGQIAEKIMQIKNNITIESITTLLNEFFIMAYNMGLLPLMVNGELDALVRKLPDDVVSEHINKDDDFLNLFKELFSTLSNDNLKYFSAAFRALFFTACYKREIGENYENALKLLIKGLVIQMFDYI